MKKRKRKGKSHVKLKIKFLFFEHTILPSPKFINFIFVINNNSSSSSIINWYTHNQRTFFYFNQDKGFKSLHLLQKIKSCPVFKAKTYIITNRFHLFPPEFRFVTKLHLLFSSISSLIFNLTWAFEKWRLVLILHTLQQKEPKTKMQKLQARQH